VENAAGKVVLVTGAGQGCGRAIAEDVAARGAAVVVNDLVDAAGEETVDHITRAGGTATYVHADVCVEQEVAALVDAAVSSFGRLDAAVNNAGTEVVVAIADSEPAQFAAVIAANLEGVRACLKHEVRVMRQHGGGAIVNMSSVTSDLTAAPMNALYGATKGGVDALTKVTAVEVAKDNISVNALAFSVRMSRTGCFNASWPPPGFRRNKSSRRCPLAACCVPKRSAQRSGSCV
jgi:NAD(P)-dependent dehydrogenase (short-subunit alcohol dehydrogenase family)